VNFRYVKGTLSHDLYYSQINEFELVGYSNSDWSGYLDDWKNTNVYFVKLINIIILLNFSRKRTA
jgi:hypothetical protein